MSTDIRILPLTGPINFRDMGGYRTATSQQTKWRTLFRADGLQTLTGEDLDLLRPLALRTVLDLRTAPELEMRGQFPVADYPVSFHHVSIIDKTWDYNDPALLELGVVDFLHTAYTDMLVEGASGFVEAFDVLAAPDALPAVFHCAAGKDRTGILAALLLGAIGVENEAIVTDYAITGQFMDAFRVRVMARSPEMAEKVRNSPAAFFAADPEAMRRVLADIDRDHGSIPNFIRTLGVPESTLTHLRQTLLKPA